MRYMTVCVGCYVAAMAALVAAAAEPEGALAAKRLETSPRHHEWVEISSGDKKLRACVVYPEVDRRTDAVVVIHENRGLTDWVRAVADRLAEEGYLAIAPDLLSGLAPGGGGTDAFASSDAARTAIYALPPEQVRADLQAVVAYARTSPASTGRVSVAGFCWGGGQAFNHAAAGDKIAAAYVFYGSTPTDANVLAAIQSPVYGFYGGNDFRITGQVPKTTVEMKRAKKLFEAVIYPQAGHGFMRSGEEPTAAAADRDAAEKAWARWLSLLGARGGSN